MTIRLSAAAGALTLALVLAAQPTIAQPPESGVKPTEADGPMVMSPADFVATANSSDAFEIQSSQMALRMSKNAQVQAFARQMIADHTKANSDLKAAASAEGLPAMPLAPNDKHAMMLKQLQDAPADRFDATYIDLQTAAHNEAVALFQTYSQKGKPGPIRDGATRTLPALKMHLDHVQKLDHAGH